METNVSEKIAKRKFFNSRSERIRYITFEYLKARMGEEVSSREILSFINDELSAVGIPHINEAVFYESLSRMVKNEEFPVLRGTFRGTYTYPTDKAHISFDEVNKFRTSSSSTYAPKIKKSSIENQVVSILQNAIKEIETSLSSQTIPMNLLLSSNVEDLKKIQSSIESVNFVTTNLSDLVDTLKN